MPAHENLLALTRAGVKHYTFVDYATQAYAALAGLIILFFHNETVPYWYWLVGAQVLCLILVHALIQGQASRPDNRGLAFLRHFYPVLLYMWFFCETGWVNRMFFSDYLDPLAISREQSLFGCQPSVLFMEKLPYLILSEVFYASYFSYYVMIAGVGVALYVRDRRQFFHYVSLVSFVFYVCYVVYIIVPIIGPRVFFHDPAWYNLPEASQKMATSHTYPDAVRGGFFFRVMGFIYRVFESPGSAVPSSHVAVAWCTVYFSFRYLRAIRYPHLVLAVLLCLATIYCRYHYVVDVLAGGATAAILIPLGNWLYLKWGEEKPSTNSG